MMGGLASAGAFESAYWVLVEVAAMSFKRWHCVAAALLILIPILGLSADDALWISADSADPGNTEIARLIEQLDKPEFAARQEASRRLSELGGEALPHLEQVAAKGSREASGRALDVLKQKFQEPGESQHSARAALERLAQGKSASAAQRARNILRPPRAATIYPVFGGLMPNGLFPRGNNIVTRTVITHESNGRREVEIKEDDVSIKMQTLPGGRIDVEITERQNGRDVKRTISAKNLDELRQKDADAAKTYEQHQPGRVQGIAGLPEAIRPPGGPAGR